MRFMDTDKQEKVKLHLRNLQSQMTELYEKIIVENATHFENPELIDEYEDYCLTSEESFMLSALLPHHNSKKEEAR